MRILGSIVHPSPALVAVLDPKDVNRGAVSSQIVGDHSLGDEGIFPQKLAHQLQRGVLVSLGLDQLVEDLAFGVDGPPKLDHSAMDFQIGFVKMPMVSEGRERQYSPWTGTMRPSQGVLHGLYVFRVIQDFYRTLFEGGSLTLGERIYRQEDRHHRG
jgi:hypothetical protein